MTPKEISDHAEAVMAALEAEFLDMLRGSDEFGWVFERLEGWAITCGVTNRLIGLTNLKFRRTVGADRAVTLYVWKLAEGKTEMTTFVNDEHERFNGDIAECVDRALAWVDSVKGGES